MADRRACRERGGTPVAGGLGRPARPCGGRPAQGRARPLAVAVVPPARRDAAGVGEPARDLLVAALVARPPVEALDEGVSRVGLPGAMACRAASALPCHRGIARRVGSVPSSEAIVPGLPWSRIAASSPRPTRAPEIGGEPSSAIARHRSQDDGERRAAPGRGRPRGSPGSTARRGRPARASAPRRPRPACARGAA